MVCKNSRKYLQKVKTYSQFVKESKSSTTSYQKLPESKYISLFHQQQLVFQYLQ